MRVVEDDAELEEYIEEAVRVSPDKPILVDQFLDDAVELDVDAVADGDDVLLGGVMEHVESAGVHSGDSACMIPPRSLGEETLARVREVTEDIARALDTVGLLNVQLAVTGVGDDDAESEVYVLEANPRSSRTVPFVSKSTGVPIAKLAAKVMTDDLTLADLDVDEQIPEHRSVKEVVLPFDRLPGSDPRLGPGDEVDRRSDGDGPLVREGVRQARRTRRTNKIPESGTAVVDLSADEFPDPDTEAGESLVAGYAEHFELSEATDLIEAAKRGEIDLIVSPAARAARSGGRRGDHLLDARLREGGARSYRPQGRRPRRDGRLRPAEARRELGRRRVDGGSTSGLSTSDTVYKRPRDRGDRL